MKKLLFFVIMCILNLQIIQAQELLNKYSLKEKNTRADNTRITLGIGTSTLLGSGDYSVLLTSNVNFHIYKPLFLTLGCDLFRVIKRDDKYANGFYLAPNIISNFDKNNFSFFGGIGLYMIAPVNEGMLPPGILFFARIENNLSRMFSIGTEIKHVKFLGDGLSSHYPFFLINLYFSYKF